MLKTEGILGYPVAAANTETCLREVASWLESGETGRFFACANPHSLVIAAEETGFSTALKEADLLTPDGVGILLASRILGGTIRERVTGSEIFAGLNEILNARRGYSYFFLGSTEETLTAIRDRLAVDFPNIAFAGSYSPPYKAEFSSEENMRMVAAVNAARPDVLWVGMTAPKQERWIWEHRDQLDVKFIGAIGAVFDFYTGRVKRSHPVFQRLGLEWLPRLLQEPKRLWRRNFVSNPLFMLRVAAHRLKHGKAKQLDASPSPPV